MVAFFSQGYIRERFELPFPSDVQSSIMREFSSTVKESRGKRINPKKKHSKADNLRFEIIKKKITVVNPNPTDSFGNIAKQELQEIKNRGLGYPRF